MLDPLSVLRLGPGLVILGGAHTTTVAMAAIRALDLSTLSAATVAVTPSAALPGVQQTIVRDLDAQLPMLDQVLLMDPDLVYVERLHRPALADRVFRAAESKRVLTTVTAESCLGMVAQLQALDISSERLLQQGPTLQVQKRIRRLCRSCRRLTTVSGDDMGRRIPTVVYEAVGCARCGGTGFKGWCFAAERLTPGLSTEGRALLRGLRKGLTGGPLREAVEAAGLVSLQQDAVRLALTGLIDHRDLVHLAV